MWFLPTVDNVSKYDSIGVFYLCIYLSIDVFIYENVNLMECPIVSFCERVDYSWYVVVGSAVLLKWGFTQHVWSVIQEVSVHVKFSATHNGW